MQNLIELPIPTFLTRTPHISTPMLQQRRNLLSRILSLKPGAVQEPKILRAGRLPREPEPVHVGSQVLVHLQRGGRRPVRVTPVCPRRGAPPWIHEGCGFGDGCVGEHLAQDGEDFFFCLGVGLALDAVGFL